MARLDRSDDDSVAFGVVDGVDGVDSAAGTSLAVSVRLLFFSKGLDVIAGQDHGVMIQGGEEGRELARSGLIFPTGKECHPSSSHLIFYSQYNPISCFPFPLSI
jgi:hypothetical protein